MNEKNKQYDQRSTIRLSLSSRRVHFAPATLSPSPTKLRSSLRLTPRRHQQQQQQQQYLQQQYLPTPTNSNQHTTNDSISNIQIVASPPPPRPPPPPSVLPTTPSLTTLSQIKQKTLSQSLQHQASPTPSTQINQVDRLRLETEAHIAGLTSNNNSLLFSRSSESQQDSNNNNSIQYYQKRHSTTLPKRTTNHQAFTSRTTANALSSQKIPTATKASTIQIIQRNLQQQQQQQQQHIQYANIDNKDEIVEKPNSIRIPQPIPQQFNQETKSYGSISMSRPTEYNDTNPYTAKDVYMNQSTQQTKQTTSGREVNSYSDVPVEQQYSHRSIKALHSQWPKKLRGYNETKAREPVANDAANRKKQRKRIQRRQRMDYLPYAPLMTSTRLLKSVQAKRRRDFISWEAHFSRRYADVKTHHYDGENTLQNGTRGNGKGRHQNEYRDEYGKRDDYGDAPSSSCGLQSPVSKKRRKKQKRKKTKKYLFRKNNKSGQENKSNSDSLSPTINNKDVTNVYTSDPDDPDDDDVGSGNGNDDEEEQEEKENQNKQVLLHATRATNNTDNSINTNPLLDTSTSNINININNAPLLKTTTTTTTTTTLPPFSSMPLRRLSSQQRTSQMTRADAISLVEIPILMRTNMNVETRRVPQTVLEECQLDTARLCRLLRERRQSIRASHVLLIQEEELRSSSHRGHSLRSSSTKNQPKDKTSSRHMTYKQAQNLSVRLQELIERTRRSRTRPRGGRAALHPSLSNHEEIEAGINVQGLGINDIDTIRDVVVPRLRAHLCLYVQN